MQVAVFGTLRDLLGVKKIEVPLPSPAPLVVLLRDLVAACPPLAGKLWTRDEKLTGDVKVMINGRALEHLADQGLNMLIRPEDKVVLFSRWASDTSWVQWL